MLKALCVLKIFTFLSCLFGFVEKRLHKKTKLHLNPLSADELFERVWPFCETVS